jgi:ribosomal protein S18 acetylase RimI-like enzyme
MTDDYADELVDVPRRAKEAVVLVAVGGGELAGAVTYVPDPSSPWAEQLREGEAGIRMLAVDPRFRGQGVGTALVDACVARARSACRDAMFLHSTPWMPAAHRIYLKAGFRRAPERDWFPRPDLPLLAFILALGAGNGNGMAAL